MFSRAVTHELNENPGILYPLAGHTTNAAGEKAYEIEDRFGDLYMSKKEGRNEDTVNSDISTTRRWNKKPGSSDVSVLIDRGDVNSTSVDIGSPIAKKVAMAAARYHDDQFIIGYYGTAWSGETGDTAVPFNSANKVAHDFGGVSVGLTKAKLLEMRRLLRKAYVMGQGEGMEPIFLLDADAETDLLSIEEYARIDYNDSKPLVRGEIKPWLGFRFFSANLTDPTAYPNSYTLSSPGAGITRLPVFAPAGIERGDWVPFFGSIDRRADKKHSQQVYGEAESNVVRTDEKKCWYMEIKQR